MIQAKVVADSLNEFGDRLTTLLVTFPRYILAELNTHRVLSKNSASSRAIPFNKMVESVEKNPFIPYAWQKDHKGMQGTEYFIHPDDILDRERMHLLGRDQAINIACAQNDAGLTKQICNRYLEPFMWHTVLISGTEWENFFKLRCPQYSYDFGDGETFYRSRKDWCRRRFEDDSKETWNSLDFPILDWLKINKGQADIHMMFLAEAIWDAMNESKPNQLKAGEWHMPLAPKYLTYREGDQTVSYIPNTEAFNEELVDQIKVATANCARTSYTVVGEETKERLSTEDIKLHDRLLESGHFSPFEHCAKVMGKDDLDKYFKVENGIVEAGWCRNFKGFIQYRAILEQQR